MYSWRKSVSTGSFALRGLVALTCILLSPDHAGGPVSLAAVSGDGTLVRYEPLSDGCVMPAGPPAVQSRSTSPTANAPQMVSSPARTIKDPYPSFAAVAIDAERGEVAFTDESLFQVLVYDRLDNTPAGAEASTPKRVLAGKRTNIEFQSGLYVDKATGELYAVNNDTRDTTLVFAAGAQGNVKPSRSIKTPHGTFGIAVAEVHGEALLTIQHDAAIVTYKKGAVETDSPIRLLQGERTGLADPHGIAYDSRDDVIFVANFGSRSANAVRSKGPQSRPNWPLERPASVPGSGTIRPPSISVHRRTATGDEAPLRVIEGPSTQLNWPTGVALDPQRRELFVTNDATHSVLVFDAAASGNIAPKRVLRGAKTGLANPTGVALDIKNREMWIANFGGHSATVYDLAASGDTRPLRAIRNGPSSAPSLMIGNPGAVAYDKKREEILVPN